MDHLPPHPSPLPTTESTSVEEPIVGERERLQAVYSASRILSFISSEFALISGAYIALARVGKALN